MKYIKENKFTIITILLLSTIMLYFINQKQGFHEDEIFSYGSSNYKYDNVFRSFGYAEARQDVIYNQVLKGNIINNTIKYIKDPNSFKKDETLSKEIPTFRTKNDALEYLTINKNDIFNYFSVYYNQSIDVHPPLFYFLVHFISTFFYNTFSKYIIFIINLAFFIGTLLIIDKIMKKINCENLSIPTMILYGASMGCISTVMFQRMYMMLTLFSILYLYNTIKFIKNDFKIDNKKLWILNIVLGFLTQYYFCIYIVLIFIIVSIHLLINKKFKIWFSYFKIHCFSAIIGIVLYPFSINHIFFSYRGISSSDGHVFSFIESFKYYISQIIKLFNFKNLLILFILLFIIALYKIIKKTIPKVDKQKLFILLVLIVPTLLFITIISKIAPFLGENYTSRYIMLLFPIIAITLFYILTFIIDKKYLFLITLTISLLLSIGGFLKNEPVYLYKDYSKVIELANQNSDKYFVYVYDNYFTHLNSMKEFTIYKESLILNKNIHDFELLDNDKLNDSDEFILCIKSWLNQDEILNKVLVGSKYTKYEKILELNSDVESVYYKITR